ncbi:hypothetical protein KFU94_70200 [Chloroflexi bacterium TSY]|nr:hypothetical protein [Chloroflexi bacterium TSY]
MAKCEQAVIATNPRQHGVILIVVTVHAVAADGLQALKAFEIVADDLQMLAILAVVKCLLQEYKTTAMELGWHAKWGLREKAGEQVETMFWVRPLRRLQSLPLIHFVA